MFTGIIEDMGEIKEIKKGGEDFEITIKSHLKEIKEGESISVDGVCLTAKVVKDNIFKVDCSKETLRLTTLRRKKEGDRVNLERALRFGERLGGHLVLGHVDGIGKIKAKRRENKSFLLTIEIPKDFERYVVKKGSIAVDGISLTVNDVSDNKFIVTIVPFTAIRTTIGEKDIGDEVNIEVDIIGKYVEKLFTGNRDSLLKKLKKYEFLMERQ